MHFDFAKPMRLGFLQLMCMRCRIYNRVLLTSSVVGCRTRKEYIDILRELRRKHPDIDMQTLESMAAAEVLNRGPKSRAFYRIQVSWRE